MQDTSDGFACTLSIYVVRTSFVLNRPYCVLASIWIVDLYMCAWVMSVVFFVRRSKLIYFDVLIQVLIIPVVAIFFVPFDLI